MAAEIVGIGGVVLLLCLCFLGANIGLAMALVGFVGYCVVDGFWSAISTVANTLFNTLATYSITVLPMFVLMGNFLSSSGIAGDLYEGIKRWVGHFRGGLGFATTLACAIFAAMCGSSLAETASVGRIVLPEMRKHGYKEEFSAGCVAAAGTLAILIPPSVAFVVYGLLTEQSIGKLLIAGIIPGVALTCVFLLLIWILLKLKPAWGPPSYKYTWFERFKSFRLLGPATVLIVIILGGIYKGVFTPTEGGAIGAAGALVLSIMKDPTRGIFLKLKEAFVESSYTIATVIQMMVGAFIFSKFLTVTRITYLFPELVVRAGLSKYEILIAVIVFYIVLGMFFDVLSGTILTVPLVFPIIVGMGFDPIWFGVLQIMLQELGLITPPIGMNVFVLSASTGVPVEVVYKGALPFVLAIMFVIVLLCLFPDLALFLPARMMG